MLLGREGGGGLAEEYSLYAFVNVDNFERPLSTRANRLTIMATEELCAS